MTTPFSDYVASKLTKQNIWMTLRAEATDMLLRESMLKPILENSILQHSNFKEALGYRLATKLKGHLLTESTWINIFNTANDLSSANSDDLETLAISDLVAILLQDPSCDSIASAFIYSKGYKAVQAYRAAHVYWKVGRRDLALAIQARVSEVLSVDIHPGAVIGSGFHIHHGSGIVIGETSVVGRNCSIQHGVTLGATGNSVTFDRHPKLGNNVLVGCYTTILGNISIGTDCKIGAGSIVLKSLPDGVAAIGNPAKIVGYTTGGNSLANVDSIGRLAEANMRAIRHSNRISSNSFDLSDSKEAETSKSAPDGQITTTTKSSGGPTLTESNTSKKDSSTASSEMDVQSAAAEKTSESANDNRHQDSSLSNNS